MLPIGDRPILVHIMRIYAHFGFREFILCLGYKGEVIKDYFRNFLWNTLDVTVHLGPQQHYDFHGESGDEDWSVTLANTGEDTLTAYRVKQIERHLGSDSTFMLTYGDGVANIDLQSSLNFHRQSGKICTLTGIHPPGRFGELTLGTDSLCRRFNEKPQAEGGYINGGFMICERAFFEYLPDDPNVMLEDGPLKTLAQDRQLAVFRHEGFWQPMDNLKEVNLLNKLWNDGNAPWLIWDGEAARSDNLGSMARVQGQLEVVR